MPQTRRALSATLLAVSLGATGPAAIAQTDARRLLADDPALESARGRAARMLLWLLDQRFTLDIGQSLATLFPQLGVFLNAYRQQKGAAS